MTDLPTPVGGDHPERDVTIRHGRERLDSVGLFIQWMAEQVNDLVGGRRIFRIELAAGYIGPTQIRLLIFSGGAPSIKKTWNVSHLNELLMADDGRGALLKEEVRGVLAQIREHQP